MLLNALFCKECEVSETDTTIEEQKKAKISQLYMQSCKKMETVAKSSMNKI